MQPTSTEQQRRTRNYTGWLLALSVLSLIPTGYRLIQFLIDSFDQIINPENTLNLNNLTLFGLKEPYLSLLLLGVPFILSLILTIGLISRMIRLKDLVPDGKGIYFLTILGGIASILQGLDVPMRLILGKNPLYSLPSDIMDYVYIGLGLFAILLSFLAISAHSKARRAHRQETLEETANLKDHQEDGYDAQRDAMDEPVEQIMATQETVLLDESVKKSLDSVEPSVKSVEESTPEAAVEPTSSRIVEREVYGTTGQMPVVTNSDASNTEKTPDHLLASAPATMAQADEPAVEREALEIFEETAAQDLAEPAVQEPNFEVVEDIPMEPGPNFTMKDNPQANGLVPAGPQSMATTLPQSDGLPKDTENFQTLEEQRPKDERSTLDANTALEHRREEDQPKVESEPFTSPKRPGKTDLRTNRKLLQHPTDPGKVIALYQVFQDGQLIKEWSDIMDKPGYPRF